MFFKLTTTSSVISLFFFAPVQAMEDELMPVEPSHFARLTPMKQNELVFSTLHLEPLSHQLVRNLHRTYIQLQQNFDALEEFFKSTSFSHSLWRQKEFFFAYSQVSTSCSVSLNASGNLNSDDSVSETPLYQLLLDLFGDHIPTLQNLIHSTLKKIENERNGKFNTFTAETKRMILQRITDISSRELTTESLAKAFVKVFKEEFRSDYHQFTSFILSQEFINFLKEHPHESSAFNSMTNIHIPRVNAIDDVNRLDGPYKGSLYHILQHAFNDNFYDLQSILQGSIKKSQS